MPAQIWEREMYKDKFKFGIFTAPWENMKENPTLALDRQLEMVEYLDRLGYDEAWFGEHHSAGMEIIGSPELMIVAAAERTKHIRLGTGVVSLPYHNPLMVAERINLLDHLTRGRAIFGAGSGALPQDAHMLGIPIEKLRDMLEESLDAVTRLLRGEVVTKETSWFKLQQARLQLPPYSRPSIEMAVANLVSPTGARAAGQFGASLLSISATSSGAFNALAANWSIAEEAARASGHKMDRSAWRMAAPFHIAETREQAREDVRHGMAEWFDYFQRVSVLPIVAQPGQDPVDAMIESGLAIIGTPDDLVAKLKLLQEESGGFGCLLNMAHNWADVAQTKKSYELVARFVFPEIQELNKARDASFEWAADIREFVVQTNDAARKALVEKLIAEQGEENVDPMLMAYLGFNKS